MRHYGIAKRFACAASPEIWSAAVRLWATHKAAAGRLRYSEAVFALVEGVEWLLPAEEPPESPRRYMRSWWEASRWRGGGFAPEDAAEAVDIVWRKAHGLAVDEAADADADGEGGVDGCETVPDKNDFGDGNGPVPAHRHVNGGGWVAE